VSVDGVRQDFVITEPLAGAAELWVELGLTRARAEAAAYGVKLILEGSGRALGVLLPVLALGCTSWMNRTRENSKPPTAA
jgi:hypothetical protein